MWISAHTGVVPTKSSKYHCLILGEGCLPLVASIERLACFSDRQSLGFATLAVSLGGVMHSPHQGDEGGYHFPV
ncbi:hypothetical protein [Rubritalea tangerina]|uniref:hypothetical protein n=1 Tax=Rubritalea tangerina TaxID=430798 RepID=UPI0036141BA7